VGPAQHRPPSPIPYFIIRFAVVERVTLPDVAVKVTPYVPALAPPGKVNVAFVLTVAPDSVTEADETAHVVFGGPPAQLSETTPLNPFSDFTSSRYVAFRPETDSEDGDEDTLKSATFTSTLDDVLGLKSPLPL
jgi:hypothetical protein